MHEVMSCNKILSHERAIVERERDRSSVPNYFKFCYELIGYYKKAFNIYYLDKKSIFS